MQKNFDIIESGQKLPATVEELVDFVIVGNEAIKSWKNKVRAIDKANIANEAYKQSLQNGQKMGELVLLAEAKLGELLSKNPRVYVGSPKVTDNAQLKSLPVGINDAIELLEKWGFDYKGILVWDKEKMGIINKRPTPIPPNTKELGILGGLL